MKPREYLPVIGLFLMFACGLAAEALAGANAAPQPPPQADKTDYSCMNAEIAAWRTAAAAPTQAQADIATSQAKAYHALSELNQSC